MSNLESQPQVTEPCSSAKPATRAKCDLSNKSGLRPLGAADRFERDLRLVVRALRVWEYKNYRHSVHYEAE